MTGDCGCAFECRGASEPIIRCDDRVSCHDGRRLVCDCGGCTQTDEPCSPGDPLSDEGLCRIPENASCGVITNSCGKTIDLGGCSSGECIGNTCISCDPWWCDDECHAMGHDAGSCSGASCSCTDFDEGPTCGDRACEGDENCATCSTDCGTCDDDDDAWCGDSWCDSNEDCGWCPSDCGSCDDGGDDDDGCDDWWGCC